MPVLAWPAGLSRPSGLTFSLKPNTQSFQSPLTRATQTLEMPGARWVAVLTWSDLGALEIRALRAFLAQLRGRAGRLSLWDMAFETPAGIATGTPVVRNRTNLFKYSSAFTNAIWTQNSNVDTDVVDVAVTAPDGGGTVSKLYEATTTSAGHTVSQSPGTLADNTIWTFSLYAKAAERDKLFIYFFTKAATQITLSVNLTTGAIVSTGGVYVARSLVSVGDGWYRLSLTGNMLSGVGTAGVQIRLLDAAGAQIYAGVVNSGMYIWGAQWEPGSTPGDYLATTTTALTELQTGASLRSGGWTPATAGILKAGDYLGVNGELKLLTTDAASDAFGNALLTFEPPLRASPPDASALTISQPTAVFRLLDDDQDTVQIQPPLRGSVTLTFEEVFQ
jgi:hypothetical protein